MKQKNYWIYLLASRRNGTLYVGLTSDLPRRIAAHKNSIVPGFTAKYAVKTLVYYQMFENHEAALAQEKRIKRWRRVWKLELVEKANPDWNDLYPELLLLQ